MMRKLRTKVAFFSVAIFSLLSCVLFAVPARAQSAAPSTLAAACTLPAPKGLTNVIFTPWYKYLGGDDISGKCSPTFDKDGDGDTTTDEITSSILSIVIAIVELLTRVGALVATGFVIYGAIQYITSQGEPQSISNAKSTIANAMIGLVITLLAISIVQFVGRALSN